VVSFNIIVSIKFIHFQILRVSVCYNIISFTNLRVVQAGHSNKICLVLKFKVGLSYLTYFNVENSARV